ncbi:D-alanyl-D-alanine endopeptidase [Solimonas soli]|uniref:D-alanyl-D-alanine endopeptidase n=1 Tax=Solimonas soli TaxID=413479 RepID=UPI0004B6E893|nr:D-alanyl-D-alanine endopeptidase [Solimonas soli]
MNRGPYRALTGVDYEVTRPRARPRRLQALLGLVALTAFGSIWLLRDDASANETAAMRTSAAATATTADATGAALRIPLTQVATTSGAGASAATAADEQGEPAAMQLAALSALPAGAQAAREAAAVQAPANAETPDEDVVDSITEQIEKKPEKRKLSLPKGLKLKSSVVLVVDQNTQEVLAEQNADTAQPIASLTKLMTALVVSEAKLPLDEIIEITRDDIDLEKHSYSRLSPGLKFTRQELLLLALMSSENRAASALGRAYPGGRAAFIRAMNAKAQQLGMTHTHYVDSNGLSSGNVSTAHDLVKLVEAAYKVPLIREFSTEVEHTVKPGRRTLHFVSSNRLVRARNDWRIGLQKTGFTNEAGRCLVMQATVKGRPLVMVLLDSDGTYTRFADAQRVRNWVEGRGSSVATKTTASSKSPSRRARARSSS